MNPTLTVPGAAEAAVSQRTHAPPTPAIPHDFFNTLMSRDPTLDLHYARQRQKLQAALHLPANNRWVADWLFLDPESRFHANVPVPPESFKNALPIQVQHHFLDLDLDTAPANTPFCPVGHGSRRLGNVPGPGCPMRNASRFHSKAANLLLMPVAAINGVTVGYTFGSVHHASPSQTRNDTFCGRFAFEASRQDLLIVTNGKQPGIPVHAVDVQVLMSFMWTADSVREHCMFLCPLRNYHYFDLPNEVLFLSSAEMRIPGRGPEPPEALETLFADNPLHVAPDLIDELLEASGATPPPDGTPSPPSDVPSFFAAPQAKSDLPWFLDAHGKPNDNVGIPRRPGDMPTSSGAFDMNTLISSLTAIEDSLRGDFYGSRQMDDMAHPQAAKSAPKSVRNVVARLSRSDDMRAADLRETAVRIYLENVLPVGADDRFLAPRVLGGLPHTAPMIGWEPQMPGKRALKIAPLPVLSSGGESDGKDQPLDEEARKREERREAKRQRNRLSAARSNEKRKEQWRMQQRTLRSLRQRVEELEGKKKTLLNENETLRERLTAVYE